MKILKIFIASILLTGCSVNPDKRSVIIIGSMSSVTNPTVYGNYIYYTNISHCSDNFEFYSDSVYKVGDTLIITKKPSHK